ncbi:hypothetical protein BC830DRAFT_1147246 [Chytriomyces sp. MP71]|nr:hypothetical protein BC830DRAFT_1147246 [Chytriomyces sp. MP71]
MTNHEVSDAVVRAVAGQFAVLKNRGHLSPEFGYFRVRRGGQSLEAVTGLACPLSDDSDTKYVAIAADAIVFSSDLRHVLLVFRCPHKRGSPHSDTDRATLDDGWFHYKGCLSTPGGFINFNTDVIDGRALDLRETAERELREECRTSRGLALEGAFHFCGAEFNLYRDVRWSGSTHHVPTVAAVFATVLKDDGLPRVRGADDACGNAYWVSLEIIEEVYADHWHVYDAFNDPFTEDSFAEFLADPALFHLDPTTGKPRNILKCENSILVDAADDHVLRYRENARYRYSDFAFDHVRNIVLARDRLLAERNGSPLPQPSSAITARRQEALPDPSHLTHLVGALITWASLAHNDVLFDALLKRGFAPPPGVPVPQKGFRARGRDADAADRAGCEELVGHVFEAAAAVGHTSVVEALCGVGFVPPQRAVEVAKRRKEVFDGMVGMLERAGSGGLVKS